jgi:hypothetical protein
MSGLSDARIVSRSVRWPNGGFKAVWEGAPVAGSLSEKTFRSLAKIIALGTTLSRFSFICFANGQKIGVIPN